MQRSEWQFNVYHLSFRAVSFKKKEKKMSDEGQGHFLEYLP